ncbi:hypothetical protein V9T40_013006 [Parthenolecanium corni]|uniref:Amino acid transporter transmembrane domain-containing protein n=1 Tax=Parthenolecanium corni TaxID=536013 RepID=A0AAN9Y0Z6_9HEMI
MVTRRRSSSNFFDTDLVNSKIKRERLKECADDDSDDAKETFDPYDYGREDGISACAAVVHILRSTIGTSILLMPYLMKNMGYLTSIILILTFSLVYYHSVHILMSVEYALCKMERVAHLSYIGVVQRIITRAPPPFNKTMNFAYATIYIYYGIPIGNTTSIIVLATNIHLMAKYFGIILNPTYIMTALIVPLTIFCLPRKLLKYLAPLSSISNGCTFLMISIVIGFSLMQPVEEASPQAFTDFSLIPRGTATFLTAIRCAGLVIPLKNGMANPKKVTSLTGVLNISGIIATTVYIAFSLIVYFNLENEVQENVLSNLPTNNRLSFTVCFMYSFALVVSYMLQFFARFETVWSGAVAESLEYSEYKTPVEYAIRIGINLLAYLMAVFCPCLVLISSVSGTIGIFVEIILPSVFQLLLMVMTKRKSRWLITKNIVIVGFSGFIFVLSATDCVFEMMKLFLEYI